MSAPKKSPYGWFEAAARAKGNPLLRDRVCVSLEALSPRGTPIRTMEDHQGSTTTKVGFALPGEPIKRGPRKGEPRFVKGSEIFEFVTRGDAAKAATEYEAATGYCADCDDGVQGCGWSAEKGRLTRTCCKCKGTGKVRGGA